LTHKPVIVRRVLGCGVVVALFLGLYGAPIVWAQAGPSPAPAAAPFPTPTPPGLVTIVISYCWCPDVAKMVPSEVTVSQGELVVVRNDLSAEAVLADRQGQVAAMIAPGASAPLQPPGPGTYVYVLVSPQSPNPPVLTVHVQPQR
jgi:hypothetical protein